MATKRFANDPNSVSRKLALALAREAEQLHAKLLAARARRGLTQARVAERIGVSQPTVASFESYDNDPKLSSLIRYAHAVGVSVEFTVRLDGVEVECGWVPAGEATFSFAVREPEPAAAGLRSIRTDFAMAA